MVEMYKLMTSRFKVHLMRTSCMKKKKPLINNPLIFYFVYNPDFGANLYIKKKCLRLVFSNFLFDSLNRFLE